MRTMEDSWFGYLAVAENSDGWNGTDYRFDPQGICWSGEAKWELVPLT